MIGLAPARGPERSPPGAHRGGSLRRRLTTGSRQLRPAPAVEAVADTAVRAAHPWSRRTFFRHRLLDKGGTHTQPGRGRLRTHEEGRQATPCLMITMNSTTSNKPGRLQKKDVKRRLTTINLPVIGGGFTIKEVETDRPTAKQALAFLEDRRVLYLPFSQEPDQVNCVRSVGEIRSRMADLLTDAKGEPLRHCLRGVIATARQFLTDVGASRYDTYVPRYPDFQFWQFLGAFRARVGQGVAILVYVFDLDVWEELESILPPVEE